MRPSKMQVTCIGSEVLYGYEAENPCGKVSPEVPITWSENQYMDDGREFDYDENDLSGWEVFAEPDEGDGLTFNEDDDVGTCGGLCPPCSKANHE